MHVFYNLCALFIAAYASSLVITGAPDEIGGGFSFRSESQSSLSGAAQITAGKGKVSSDAAASARGNLDSQIRVGGYLASNGTYIGANGGVNENLRGSARGSVHGEVAQNKDGTITAAANGTLSSTSNAGVSGHANIATGDEELRQIAEYEGNSIERISRGRGTLFDLGPLISSTSNVVENFWLYFWLVIGGVIFITCCCVFTVCGFYWKLFAAVNSLKTQKTETAAFDKKHTVNINDWDTKLY